MLNAILPFYLGCLLTIATAQAELKSLGENPSSDLSHISLPKCIDDEKTVKDIKSTMKANLDSEHKYNGYKDALQSSTDLEVASRLAYAEVLAANCSKHNSQIIRPITEVIANRIALKKNDIRKVVFQRNQFASSLNNYCSSRYKDFMCPTDLTKNCDPKKIHPFENPKRRCPPDPNKFCPTDLKLWHEVQTQMEIALQKTKDDSTRLLPRNTVHYYLFNHDKKFKVPTWAEGPKAYPQAEFKDSATLKECVKFYRNDKWE